MSVQCLSCVLCLLPTYCVIPGMSVLCICSVSGVCNIVLASVRLQSVTYVCTSVVGVSSQMVDPARVPFIPDASDAHTTELLVAELARE